MVVLDDQNRLFLYYFNRFECTFECEKEVFTESNIVVSVIWKKNEVVYLSSNGIICFINSINSEIMQKHQLNIDQNIKQINNFISHPQSDHIFIIS